MAQARNSDNVLGTVTTLEFLNCSRSAAEVVVMEREGSHGQKRRTSKGLDLGSLTFSGLANWNKSGQRTFYDMVGWVCAVIKMPD